MSRVKSSGTTIEKTMEGILKDLKLKYEFQPRLYGHPDFRITGTRILIFCDGSFWHGRRKGDVVGTSFSKNREFWVEKITTNKRRDLHTTRNLRREGWLVLRFWDDEIEKQSNSIRNQIRRVLDESSPR